MHPAPSVILFTVLSGMGFGLMVFLGAFAQLSGWTAFFWWAGAYGLSVGGLLFSTFHLGNPQRFLLAFTQWRSSWLSREACVSTLTLIWFVPSVLSQWLGFDWPQAWAWAGSLFALLTVFTTSMIYAQLATVPRWNTWLTPAVFLGFAVTGGALLTGHAWLTAALSGVLGVLVYAYWKTGDKAFARRGQDLGTATGLGGMGTVTVFEQAHTADNYLMREMIYVVARKHRMRLRIIAAYSLVLLPVLTLILVPNQVLATCLAAVLHLIGALATRWLFFAEAEHVVGLYYGRTV